MYVKGQIRQFDDPTQGDRGFPGARGKRGDKGDSGDPGSAGPMVTSTVQVETVHDLVLHANVALVL